MLWKREELDYRTLAEGLRVQLYWNLTGVVEKEWAGFAYDHFLLKQDPDLGWIRHVMRQASMYRLRGVAPDVRWLDWVIRQWVGGRSEKQGQLSYYTRKERENSARFRRTQRLGTLCLWVGIGTPKQERWMAEHVGKLNAKVMLSVGAAFDFHAGLVKQAPRWISAMSFGPEKSRLAKSEASQPLVDVAGSAGQSGVPRARSTPMMPPATSPRPGRWCARR